MSFEYFIGRRYLRAKQKYAFISLITLFSVAGVAVGVMALIVVIAVMSGFESDLTSRILGINSHIVIKRTDADFTQHEKVLAYLNQTKKIVSAAPFVSAQTMLRSNSGAAGAMVRGIDPEQMGKSLRTYFDPNRLNQKSNLPGVILGRELARNLGVITQDLIYIISPKGMISPVGHIPAMRKFEVLGIFETGMYEYDGTTAYIHIKNAQRLMRMKKAVSGVEIWMDDPDHALKIAEKIKKDLGDNYKIQDWMQMNLNFFSALKLEKTVMFIIMSLIVMVAAFNIASSLIMMVIEKKRDIAILKAMGASDKSIQKIFVFKGTVIGAVGTISGASSGTFLCDLLKRYEFIQLPSDIYYITTLPVKLETVNVCIITLAAMVICFLATLYPAKQAAKADPIAALRNG